MKDRFTNLYDGNIILNPTAKYYKNFQYNYNVITRLFNPFDKYNRELLRRIIIFINVIVLLASFTFAMYVTFAERHLEYTQFAVFPSLYFVLQAILKFGKFLLAESADEPYDLTSAQKEIMISKIFCVQLLQEVLVLLTYTSLSDLNLDLAGIFYLSSYIIFIVTEYVFIKMDYPTVSGNEDIFKLKRMYLFWLMILVMGFTYSVLFLFSSLRLP